MKSSNETQAKIISDIRAENSKLESEKSNMEIKIKNLEINIEKLKKQEFENKISEQNPEHCENQRDLES